LIPLRERQSRERSKGKPDDVERKAAEGAGDREFHFIVEGESNQGDRLLSNLVEREANLCDTLIRRLSLQDSSLGRPDVIGFNDLQTPSANNSVKRQKRWPDRDRRTAKVLVANARLNGYPVQHSDANCRF
jgi:hypothetical protein